MPEHKECLLSLALIMRDMAGEILNCLESVADAVDEMVIVDTGSVDDSVAVVRGFLEKWQQEGKGRRWHLYGAKWRDDFAWAKNQALLRCHGRYVIFLDSDEYISEDTRGNLRPLVEAFDRGEWPQGIVPVELPGGRTPVPGRDMFDVLEIFRENVDLEGKPVPDEPDDPATRLLRRQEGLQYEGEVHEQLLFADGRGTKMALAEQSCLKLKHTGYRPGLKEKKEERNYRILLKEEAQGGSTKLKDYYLAEIHRDRKEWRQALAAGWRCLNGSRPVQDKMGPYRIMYEAARGLEREMAEKAGLAWEEGMRFSEERPGEPDYMKEARKIRQYAENVLAGAMGEFPDYPEPYYYRGLLRWKSGEKAAGRADLVKAKDLAEAFPVKHADEVFSVEKHLPKLPELLEEIAQEPPQQQEKVDTAEAEKWQIYVAGADTLGGRLTRRQLSLDGEIYKVLEETSPEERQAETMAKGLILPFLEIDRENQKEYLPKVALAMQKARDFRRIIVMMREPLTEVLALLQRHRQKGLPCVAVCAAPGDIFGGEQEGEFFTPVEELLDLLAERIDSSSPRKRLLLPYRENESLRLKYVWDLAGAAVYAVKNYQGQEPLLLEGETLSYGELAGLAKEALGFQGRLQFGKGRLHKLEAVPRGFRTMHVSRACGMKLALQYLARKRKRKGETFLSACLIMRDSEADIGRCLKSLRQADEIIVVDTGSVDRSVEIAKVYTDKVYHFKWIDDFAAAKNFALDHARGDMITFPDSDEFFTEETAAGLHRLAEDYDIPGEERQFLVRMSNVDKNLQPLNKEGAEAATCRFFSFGVRFIGAIHEVMVAPSGMRPLPTSIPRERCLMYHTGYDPERIQKKLDRNARMLRLAHEAGKDIPLQHYCMGKTYESEKKYEEARAEMILARQAETIPANLRAEIYRVWYNASKKLGDEKAMDEAMAAMREDMPNMPDSYAVEGSNFWSKGQQEEAAPLLLRALELSRDFLQYNPNEVNVVAKDMPKVAQALAGFYEEKGQQEMAERVRNILTAL